MSTDLNVGEAECATCRSRYLFTASSGCPWCRTTTITGASVEVAPSRPPTPAPARPGADINWPVQARSDEEIALEFATWMRGYTTWATNEHQREVMLARAAWLEEIADRAARYAASAEGTK